MGKQHATMMIWICLVLFCSAADATANNTGHVPKEWPQLSFLIMALVLLAGGLTIAMIRLKQLRARLGETTGALTENRIIQEALKDSEDTHRAVLANISDAVFITDDTGRFTFICPNVNVIFGYSGEEVAAMGTITRLLGRQTVAPAALKKTGEIRNQNWAVRDKSGETHNLLVNIKQVRIKDGTLMYSCRDVTERHRAEQALMESEKKFKRMFEQAPLSYQSLDAKGNFTAVNDTWLASLGYRREEVLGHNFSEFLKPEWKDHFARNFPRFKAVGEILGVEFEMVKKNGSPILVSFHGKIGRDRSGNFKCTHCVFTDITLQRSAEFTVRNELRLHQAIAGISKELLSEIYDIKKVSDIVLEYARNLTHSAVGFVSAIDKHTRDNLGHTMADMSGDACRMDDAQAVAFSIGKDGKYPGLWGHALNTGEAFFTNTPERHPSSTGLPGGHVPLKNYLAVPVMTGKRLLGLIALANADREYSEQDLTSIQRIAEVFAFALHRAEYDAERRKLELNLKQLQKAEAISALASGIAHDFNNILFPIVGFAEMMEEDLKPDSPLKKNVGEILAGAKRAKELVKQILAFSRQSDQEVVPLQPHLIVKEVVKLIKATMPSFIQIRQRIDSRCRSVMADPTQIHQVTMNLVTNAFHAMEDNGGTMTITLENRDVPENDPEFPEMAPGPCVLLSVRDTGCGIPGHTIHRIFDPYFTTKPKDKGTGLGLPVVQGIVKHYKGDIRVVSAPGKGTEFSVCLPAFKGRQASEQCETTRGVPKGHGRIMVVDDEPVILELEEQMLVRLGYSPQIFQDSEAALKAIRSAPETYDLVITDMTMPGLTGDRFTLAVREAAPDLPIIICTGFSERISPEKAEAIGAQGLLYKPVIKADMARILNRILGPARP